MSLKCIASLGLPTTEFRACATHHSNPYKVSWLRLFSDLMKCSESMKACLCSNSMFCEREYQIGIKTIQQNDKSTQCERWIRFQSLPKRAPMENIDTTYPMELVHMDYLTIEVNECGKDVHNLVIKDHLTWYAQAIITSS